jgi:NAD(P)-dependent dehydrogenase (short-subunit alcohol dehydrogenase family)
MSSASPNAASSPLVWFITGCSSGLGAAIARAALAAGDHVVATARNEQSLAGLVASAPSRCRAYALDVTNTAQLRDVTQRALGVHGHIDVLVSNAGAGMIAALEECSDEQIARSIATNFVAPLKLIRAVLPAMRARRSGHIMAISAIAALSNHEGFSVYGGAKAGLEAALEALAIEVKPLGIRTSMVLPGPTRTDFIARNLETGASTISDYAPTSGKFGTFLKSISGKQTGDADKVASLVVALSREPSPPLRVVTGKYATIRAKAKLRALGAEIEAWEARAAATDY